MNIHKYSLSEFKFTFFQLKVTELILTFFLLLFFLEALLMFPITLPSFFSFVPTLLPCFFTSFCPALLKCHAKVQNPFYIQNIPWACHNVRANVFTCPATTESDCSQSTCYNRRSYWSCERQGRHMMSY